MADLELVGLARGERLGAAGYLRVLLERPRATRDGAWLDAIKRLREKLPATGIGSVVSPLAAVAADTVAAVDVKPSTGGAQRTVADLANAIEQTLDKWGPNAARIRSIERVASVGTGAANAREELQRREELRLAEERERDPLGVLLGRLKSLGTVAYWLIILAMIAGVGYIGWQIYAASKAARKATA